MVLIWKPISTFFKPQFLKEIEHTFINKEIYARKVDTINKGAN
jgi:hypothetical protein